MDSLKLDFTDANKFFSDYFGTQVKFEFEEPFYSEDELFHEDNIVRIISNDLHNSNKLLELALRDLYIYGEGSYKGDYIKGIFCTDGAIKHGTNIDEVKIANFIYKNGRWDITLDIQED